MVQAEHKKDYLFSKSTYTVCSMNIEHIEKSTYEYHPGLSLLRNQAMLSEQMDWGTLQCSTVLNLAG
jgi:hypothetical protein